MFLILVAGAGCPSLARVKQDRTEQGDVWVGLGRGGRAPGRSDHGKIGRWRTQTLGRDLPLISGARRCAELSILSFVKPRAGLSAVVLGLIVLEGGIGGLLARLAPWPWLSPVLIIISVYAAVWIIGIYASLRTFPHLVTQRGLLLRYGVLGEAWIPWREVDHVVRETLVSPGGMDGLSTKGDIATLAVGGRTTVTIRRRSPGKVKGFLRETAGISQIRVAADDPDAFLAAIAAEIPHDADQVG